MIKRLIWTIWTPMSPVLKKAEKLNLSLFPCKKNEIDNFCKIEAFFPASIYICSLVFVFDPIFVIVFIFKTEKMYLYWSCWWNGFDPGPGLLNEMFSILNLNPSDICMTRSQNVHLFWPKESYVNEVKNTTIFIKKSDLKWHMHKKVRLDISGNFHLPDFQHFAFVQYR